MFCIVIKWNDRVVLQGTCSSVMAYENTRIMAAQFGNAHLAGLKIPSLDDLCHAASGDTFTSSGTENGTASYSLTKI